MNNNCHGYLTVFGSNPNVLFWTTPSASDYVDAAKFKYTVFNIACLISSV